MEFINIILWIGDFGMNTHVDIWKKYNSNRSSVLILQSKCKNNHVCEKPRIKINFEKIYH